MSFESNINQFLKTCYVGKINIQMKMISELDLISEIVKVNT